MTLSSFIDILFSSMDMKSDKSSKSGVGVLCILSLALVGLLRIPASGQTMDEIRNAMIKAQGGKAVIEKIKDMTVTGMIEVPQQDLNVSFIQYKKEPDKRRIEMKVMGTVQVQGFDGERAWEMDPLAKTAIEIPGKDAIDIKRGSLALSWILYPEKYGISLVLKGKEKIDGKDYFIVEQIYSGGDKETLYVNSETFLIFKIKSSILDEMMVEVETETNLTDYKSVGGYVMAHKLISFLHGKEYMRLIYKKVKLNTGLNNSLFMVLK